MNALQHFISTHDWLTTEEETAKLIKIDRLCPVLVRCGGCRFTCGAQYIPHLIKCVVAGGDYVRDLSFPVGSMDRAANWTPEPPPIRSEFVRMPTVDSRPAKQSREAWSLNRHHVEFNENDCGGVFDGNQVTSDADPGL